MNQTEVSPFSADWWFKMYLEAYLRIDDLDTSEVIDALGEDECQRKSIKYARVMKYCRRRAKSAVPSRVLTKIEELPDSLYLEYGRANMSMVLKAVKSLIKQELER